MPKNAQSRMRTIWVNGRYVFPRPFDVEREEEVHLQGDHEAETAADHEDSEPLDREREVADHAAQHGTDAQDDIQFGLFGLLPVVLPQQRQEDVAAARAG